MNEKMDDALVFGHDVLEGIGITPIIGVSTLLELFVFNGLFTTGEVDFFIDGDKLTKELIETIKKTSGFSKWENEKAILYFGATNGVRITYVPYYTRDKVYANIRADEYFVWDKKHFDTQQTKRYMKKTYTIPNDPVGYLEAYYGTPWDDFFGREGWNWHKAKNLTKMERMSV